MGKLPSRSNGVHIDITSQVKVGGRQMRGGSSISLKIFYFSSIKFIDFYFDIKLSSLGLIIVIRSFLESISCPTTKNESVSS